MKALRTRGILVLLLAVAACALMTKSATPESKLVTGYKTVTAVAKSADVLVLTNQLSSKNGQVVVDMSTTAQTALNNGTEQLQACLDAQAAAAKAAGVPVVLDSTKCAAAVSTVDMASSVLNALTTYLVANGGKL